MLKSHKLRAHAHFSSSQKAADQFIKEKETASQERAAKVERLRTLRLAAEAAAAAVGAETPAAKSAKPANKPASQDV
ncbi:MAG: hypothetical protein RL477_1069 [Pseudomonadota bacterium]|jgi:hypothetical protein